jgi:protein O-mannosyl-transferase
MALRPKLRPAILAPLVAPAIAVLCYWNSLGGDFVWDDQKLIVEDYSIKNPRDLFQILGNDFFFRHENDVGYGYYRPLTTLSYAADHALWGESPRGYHATNVVLHAACSLLVVALLTALGVGRPASVFAGAIFAAHPIHTEAVAWISGRTDLLAFLLGGASLWLHLKSADAAAALRSRRAFLATSVAAFALALLAKEMAGAVALWVALAYVFLSKREPRRIAWALAPYAAVLVGYAVLRFHALEIPVPGQPKEHTLAAVVLGAPALILRYLEWMVVPLEQSAYIRNPYVETAWDPRFIAGLAVVALAAAVAWRALRGPRAASARFLLAALAVSFLPIVNIVRVAGPLDMGNPMSERFCYFPSFPLYGLFGIGLDALSRRMTRPARRIAVFGAAAAIVAVACAATVRRNAVWRDEPTLFEDALARSPGSALILGNLAKHYVKSGDLAAAERVLSRIGTESRDGYEYASVRALLHVTRHEYAEALGYQEEIVRRSQPGNAAARNNLAFLYRAVGRTADAGALLAPIVDGGHGYADVFFNLAEVRRSESRFGEARELFRRALDERPDSVEIGAAFAAFELQRGDARAARDIYEGLLEHHPRDPGLLNNLCVASERDGDIASAIAACSRALEATPGYDKARKNLERLKRPLRSPSEEPGE